MSSITAIAETVTSASTVNETLSRFPETVKVFNEFAIDTCCGGAASIGEAAKRDGADAGELLSALAQAIAAQRNSARAAS